MAIPSFKTMLREASLLLLSVVTGSYLVLIGMGIFQSDKLIFARGPSSYTDAPELLKLDIPGVGSIAALYLENPNAQFTLLLSHGNAEDLGRIRAWCDYLKLSGFSVLAYDYEGYGTSDGTPTEAAANRDELAVYDYLKTTLRISPNHIIAMGKSLGSGPATYLASKEPVAGLVLQSPYTSTFRVMTHYRILPFDKFANYRIIDRVQCPILIIHGTADSMIPIWHGEELYKLANEPKFHLWVDGANHNDLEEVAGERYAQTLQQFALELAKRQAKSQG